jgi:hypothetical protein
MFKILDDWSCGGWGVFIAPNHQSSRWVGCWRWAPRTVRCTTEQTRDENGFRIFRNFDTVFGVFPIGLVGNGIFGNGIGCRNFNSELVSKTVQRSTDRLYRLPIFNRNLPDSSFGISGN